MRIEQRQVCDVCADVYETEIRLTLANDTANTSQLQWGGMRLGKSEGGGGGRVMRSSLVQIIT